MIHVEHGKEIEFLTMASLYPIFHGEEMQDLIHIEDEMVEEHFQTNKEAYRYPAHAKLSMIVINGGDNSEDKKKALEKAQKALQRVKTFLFFF
jgi:hypothetical protein